LKYETNSIWRIVFNFFFIPILNILPRSSNTLIRRSHKSVNEVITQATTHKALEILYQNDYKRYGDSLLERLSHRIWFGTNNSKAVRNRLRLVKRELAESIFFISRVQKDISILSIASGSARAVIEALLEIEIPPEKRITITFVDKDSSALEYSRKIVKTHNKLGSNFNFAWVEGTASSFLEKCTVNQFSIIEMVGLLDYFDEQRVLNIFSEIKRVLIDGGFFITANVNDNSERRFLTRIVGWDMVYRSAIELGELLLKAGFSNDKIKLYYEPLNIHGVSVVRK